MRTDQLAAAALGVPVVRVKLAAFAFSAATAAMSGGLLAFHFRFLSPEMVGVARSFELVSMLADGELDAFHTARAPSTFYSEPGRVRRLFPDYVAVEREYFRRTRIFPIMHVIAIRRAVYRANPWIATSLFKAFVASQRITYEGLMVTAALKTMLPWQVAAVEEARREMGEDWWSYGFHANRHVLETFVRYHHEQGLSKRLLRPEELFAPETLEAFRI